MLSRCDVHPCPVANIVYFVEAKKVKVLTGTAPQGYGCLWALLVVVAIVPPLIAIVGDHSFFCVTLGRASKNGTMRRKEKNPDGERRRSDGSRNSP